MDGLVGFIGQAWPYLIVAAPGLWAAWRQWRTAQKVERKDRTDLVRVAQEAAGEVIEDLREEARRLRERLEVVEGSLNKLRQDHSEMMASKDARIALLEGEKQMLEQYAHGLEDILKRHEIALPVRSQTYWESRDGQLTPIQLEVQP